MLGPFANGQIINSVGIKTGLSVANQTWYYKSINMTLKKDYKLGLYSAMTVDFLKSKYFNITTDIGYCSKGNTEKVPNTSGFIPQGDGTYTTYNTMFNYFSFSPLLKIKYAIAHFIPYVLLGLRWDYQLSYKSDFNYTQIENDFYKSIYGLTCGTGIEYKIKNIGINSEFQYQYDITKLMDTPASPTNTGLEINNKAFIISIGLKYYFHKI